MAAALDDLIQVRCKASYLDVDTLNVWYYRLTTEGADPDQAYSVVADAFENTILPTIADWQNNWFIWQEIEIQNLSNGVDLYTRQINIPGQNIQPIDLAVPSFVTFGWKINRDSRNTRNGYKRFSGLMETQVTGNEAGLTQQEQEDTANVITTSIVDQGWGWQDIIVKRPLPEPGEPYTYSGMLGATFRGLGTQNSRKPKK